MLVSALAAGTAGAAVPGPADTPRTTAAMAEEDAPLAVTIGSMLPAAVPERGPIRIRGTVTNASDELWTDINLIPFVNPSDALTSADDLATAADTESDAVVGGRIVEVLDKVDELEPGESADYRLRVPRSLLTMTEPGVYWFGVHASGRSDSTPRDAVADGRARTFLPYLPDTDEAVETAVVVPVRARIDHTQRGAIARTSAWERWMTTGGRLRDAVEFGEAAAGRPMSWLLDPAVPDAARQLADGNPIRSVEPTIDPDDDGDDGDGEGEGEPSGSASTDAGAGGDATEDADAETAAPDPSAVAALRWLSDTRSAMQQGEVLALPYGDIDVAAAAKHAPELYGLAREPRGAVLTQWQLSTRPVVTSPSGYIDDDGLSLIDDDALVLATDRMFEDENFPDGVPDVARIEGQQVAVTSYGATRGGPGPDPRLAPVALRQRLLSEAAVRLLDDTAPATEESAEQTAPEGPDPLLAVMPPQITADGADEFWSGLDQDWVDLTTVSDATDRPSTAVDTELLRYPRRQERLELNAGQLDLARQVIDRGGTLQQVLTLNDAIAGRLTDEALAGVSYSQRTAPTEEQLRLTLGWVQRRLAAITVNAPPGVTLSSDAGGFVVTVTNNLRQPVTVQLESTSQQGATTEPVEPVRIPPGTRTTVALDVRTVALGVDNLTIRVTDSTGEELGDSVTVPVRPGQISTVIWWIIGAGAALLFVAIAIRLVRRVRRRHHAPDPEPEDDPAEQAP